MNNPNPMSLMPDSTSETTLRPSFEGTNICTWIGFKHVNYLVEEAVLNHFRSAGFGPGKLFEEFGVGFDTVDIKTRILHALHIDDLIRAEVTQLEGKDGIAWFRIHLYLDRDGTEIKAVSAKIGVVLRRDSRHGGTAAELPWELQLFAVDTLNRGEQRAVAFKGGSIAGRNQVTSDVDSALLTKGGKALAWHWRIPYFYCHHTVRLQMSGLLRNMEEIVDLFVEEHNASIRTLLDEQDWIPVVPVSHITMFGEAHMEEEILTVFEVEHVFKQSTYAARMDTYVVRGKELVLISTGTITHGYARIGSRSDWSLIEFDDRLMAGVK